eukprot:CAMPEP_0172536932 /NCGR_PEP_ID=MMETSP1067-20121228/8642_1 /TAXON_ID=265564 ORGANISM="Thalassiosira punctigera, Strain Tpunct2005C2" /NCGR_SAMPLE_ID=MMETSP1067 /ASSEMBLY_ACC=CAM_ASM_000444 /LENGTH=167 /DNA_ID=CAMNT_0013322119 /DNA_START=43 /DNA_END=546 /DNA_ORIENTATION=+
MASLLVASTTFQLITFVAFNDKSCKDDHENLTFVDCSIEEGSAFAISACLFYLLACIGMFIVSPPIVPLIRFEEGWRGGVGAAVGGSEPNNGNGKVTTVGMPVLVLHEEQAKPISSTSPQTGTVPDNDNLLHAGASMSREEDEEIDTSRPNDAESKVDEVELGVASI